MARRSVKRTRQVSEEIPHLEIFLPSHGFLFTQLDGRMPQYIQQRLLRSLNQGFSTALHIAEIEEIKPVPSELKAYFLQVKTHARSLAKILSPKSMPPSIVEQALPTLSVCCDEWYGPNGSPSIGERFLELPNTLDFLAKTAERAVAGFSAENRKTNYGRSFVHYIFFDLDHLYQLAFNRAPRLQNNDRDYVGPAIPWARRIFQVAAERIKSIDSHKTAELPTSSQGSRHDQSANRSCLSGPWRESQVQSNAAAQIRRAAANERYSSTRRGYLRKGRYRRGLSANETIRSAIANARTARPQITRACRLKPDGISTLARGI